MRILLVEDDVMIGESLRHALKGIGYAVNWVKDGDMAIETLANESYDLMLLDLGLPGQSGLTVLRTARKNKKSLPVLIITARDAIADRVAGLDSGADDYLVKPFALAEVEARLRALLRRHSNQPDPVLTAGEVALDTGTKELHYREKTLILTAREYALMYALLEKPGVVLSRAQLEEKLYGWNEEIASNAVEVQIHQLRKKMGNELIRNIRGVGYSVARA